MGVRVPRVRGWTGVLSQAPDWAEVELIFGEAGDAMAVGRGRQQERGQQVWGARNPKQERA